MEMHAKSLIEALAQEWYVLAAYVATFVLLEIRKHGERVAMHRIARHALWATSCVAILHAAVVAVATIRQGGLDFIVIDYVAVTILTGSVLFLLGHMFERVPQRVTQTIGDNR